MKINKFEDFVLLLEQYTTEEKFNAQIKIEGVAKYKDYLFSVNQYLENQLDTGKLSKLNKRLYHALERLTPEERKSILVATLTSYFTPEDITNAISKELLDYFNGHEAQRLNILEPSAGSGNFISSLLQNNAQLDTPIDLTIDAVEKDIFTANILANNFKELDNIKVINSGYENTVEKKYDAIVSNIPFGSFDVFDQTLTKQERELVNGKIHNYFFLKAKNQLNPGGLIMFITSKDVADSKENNHLRELLVKELNLITAIRLPDETFKKQGTKIVTDLLVFQKPLVPKFTLNPLEEAFRETNMLQEFEQHIPYNINAYFQKKKENSLGAYYLTTGVKGKQTISLKQNNTTSNFAAQLRNDCKDFLEKSPFFLNRIVENKEDKQNQAIQEQEEIKQQYPFAVVGNLIVSNNTFYRIDLHPDYKNLIKKSPVEIKANQKERALLFIQLREEYKTFREALRENEETQAKKLQEELNHTYDNFYFFYNNINAKENREILFLEGEREVIKNLERETSPGIYEKADIFSESIFRKQTIEEGVKSINDAIYLSMNKYGKIEQDYISSILKNENWIQEALEDKAIYINPVFAEDYCSVVNYELVLPNKFLSGFIEGKLSVYSSPNLNQENKYSQYLNRRIIDQAKEDLIQILPIKLSIQEIDPSLGEPWIDTSVFEMFAKEHFDEPNLKILYNNTIDSYRIIGGNSSIGASNYSISKNQYNKHVSYKDILKYALLQVIPEFTKKIEIKGEIVKISDKELNTAVQTTVERLQNQFSEWLMKKEKIAESLENQYHFLNNAFVKEKFDASYMNFEIDLFEPYLHQKNVAIEMANNNGGIIDHKVGYGKTLSMAMLTMIKKKFNINKKELIIGLNANYIDIYKDCLAAYPNGKFLLVTTDDLAPNKAKETFYKIANNSWDAVITAHSNLIKFPRDPESESEILMKILEEIESTIKDDVENGKLLSRGEMNRLLKKQESVIQEQKEIVHALNSKKDSGSLVFSDLGFDGIIIDESQYFKNLEFSTKHTRVAGLGNLQQVKKTRNLLSYIRNIQKINKGKGLYGGVTFATGTTINNTITELYTLFKYISPEQLRQKKIDTFDRWARVYARKSYEYEESVTGQIKLKERFRYFVKVPELAKMYYGMTNYADEKVFEIDKPKLKYEMTVIEPDQELNKILESIRKFGLEKDYKHIGFYNGAKNEKAIGLICTSLGKKAALSVKLIDKDIPDDPNDKINTMVNKIHKYYSEFDKDKGTQLIFCDQGTPKTEGFNIYNFIKEKLVEKGVPENEVAFIHSYDNKRSFLYQCVNSGKIRILIGSTEKMGVGVNVQERLVALHHLDLPWRPSDLDQRNGRGGRPGNKIIHNYGNVLPVHFYGTKGTLDAYNFNLLKIKQNFIDQIKNSSISSRKVDEGLIDSEGGMNFEQYLAACSSNQYLTDKMKAERELQRLVEERETYTLRERQNKIKLNYIITDIAKLEKQLNKLKDALEESKKIDFLVINGKKHNEKEIAYYYLAQLKERFKSTPGTLAKFDKNFEIIVEAKDNTKKFSEKNYSVYLLTHNKIKLGYKSRNFTKKESEIANYPKECALRIKEIILEQESILKNYLTQKESINKALEIKFNKEPEVEAKRKEIKNLEDKIIEENKRLEGGGGQSQTEKVKNGIKTKI